VLVLDRGLVLGRGQVLEPGLVQVLV